MSDLGGSGLISNLDLHTMEEVDDEVITQCRIFIDNFNKGSIDEDYLESREAPKFVTDDDLNAEILDWVFGYLKSV